MSCITKCQCFKGRFSEVDVWSPTITKRIVSRSIIAIFSVLTHSLFSTLFSVFPATALPELANVDALVTAMESQVETIRCRLQEELDAIPKAKV